MDVMIDLEALSSRDKNAAIVSIGAVAFDRCDLSIVSKFYRVIDIESALTSGGVVDGETIGWWLRQSDAARSAITDSGQAVNHASALVDFAAFLRRLGREQEILVWGKGSDYDNVILRNAYERTGQVCPWKFRNNRCFRTLMAEYPEVEFVHDGQAHNAIDDAVAQVHHFFRIERFVRTRVAA